MPALILSQVFEGSIPFIPSNSWNFLLSALV